jgi:CheY-like chemotaxis protein
MMLENGLKKHGFHVFGATSGESGINVFQQNHVDVIVCDLGMDGMDGWQVCSEIEKLSNLNSRPRPYFVLLTGWADEIADHQEENLKCVDRILHKPIEILTLAETLKTLVGKK